MYLSFWNLREHPFQNVDDTRFTYLSEQHHEGLARLVYIIQNRKLGGVLTGPYGAGKTMVLELLAQQIQEDARTCYVWIDYFPGTTVSLARYLLTAMGYDAATLAQVNEVMDAFRILRTGTRKLTHTTLVIDEAQAITDPSVYQFLHMLMNITLFDEQKRAKGAAFTVILSGYNNMTQLLSKDESLCQRLQMLWQLEPLNRRQVQEYVQHRMRVAGGDIWVFDQDAIDELASATGGIPRLINNICDISLMLGYAANQSKVSRTLMKQAIADACYPFGLKGGANQPSDAASSGSPVS